MIDVMKRLAELDAGNPNIVNPITQLAAAKHAPVTENRTPVTEAEGNDLRVLAGVKQKSNLTESAIAECGMMPMGAPMPSTIPASINMSAGNANEIVSMMRGIMDLAKSETGFSDGPSMSHIPAMGAPMPGLGLPMGDIDHDGDHDMRDHDLEAPDAGPLMGADDDKMVSGPTFGDDAGADDSGADELADIMKKIKTGQPVKIKTDMPVKVTSDEPIKGTTDKLNKVSGDGPISGDEDESYDNSPKPASKGDGDDFANIINKVRSADMTTTPANSGSNPMPDEEKKEESFANAFEAKLMAEYKKFVNEATTLEGEKKTMSRAAKGHEKYGKEGMAALAKAGRDGASEEKLDKIRDKHDNYNEGMMDKVKDTVKKGVKAVDKLVTGGDKEDLIKDLQKKAGVSQTGKKPDSK